MWAISGDDLQELCESMDLAPEQVFELFDRAEARWQAIIDADAVDAWVEDGARGLFALGQALMEPHRQAEDKP